MVPKGRDPIIAKYLRNEVLRRFKGFFRYSILEGITCLHSAGDPHEEEADEFQHGMVENTMRNMRMCQRVPMTIVDFHDVLLGSIGWICLLIHGLSPAAEHKEQGGQWN